MACSTEPSNTVDELCYSEIAFLLPPGVTTSGGTRVHVFLYAHPILEQVIALRVLLYDRG